MDTSTGHSKVGFVAVISEAMPGDHISHTKLEDTCSGVVTLDYPASAQRDGNVQVSGVFRGERARKYLIYHVDKRLSIVPAYILNRHSFIAVEDVCDQGDALRCGERTTNQASPRWNPATREKMVRQINAWVQS